MRQVCDLNSKELLQAHKYFDFVVWLHENGWQPYVDDEIYINTNEGNKTRHVDELYKEYFRELPEDIKEIL